jgi:hypothetical protein
MINHASACLWCGSTTRKRFCSTPYRRAFDKVADALAKEIKTGNLSRAELQVLSNAPASRAAALASRTLSKS